MYLERSEAVADDLERGLGELHWMFEAIRPDLRLRSEGVCGLVSIALAEHLTRQGYDATTVISSPRLAIDQTIQHVVPVVRVDGHEVVIDATYSQFLSLAGMSHGYVENGGASLFPENKIEHIVDGANDALVNTMTRIAAESLGSLQEIDDFDPRTPDFLSLSEEEIRGAYAAIWDPAHFEAYHPTEGTLEGGRRLAAYILPEHVRLIA